MIKHHPGIIEDLYPKLALVIIKLNSTIISAGEEKKIICGHKSIVLKWNWRYLLICRFLSVMDSVFLSVSQHMWWSASCMMVSMIKNISEVEGVEASEDCCIIFIKVTLTVGTTQINDFILPSTLHQVLFTFLMGVIWRERGGARSHWAGPEHPKDLSQTPTH